MEVENGNSFHSETLSLLSLNDRSAQIFQKQKKILIVRKLIIYSHKNSKFILRVILSLVYLEFIRLDLKVEAIRNKVLSLLSGLKIQDDRFWLQIFYFVIIHRQGNSQAVWISLNWANPKWANFIHSALLEFVQDTNYRAYREFNKEGVQRVHVTFQWYQQFLQLFWHTELLYKR